MDPSTPAGGTPGLAVPKPSKEKSGANLALAKAGGKSAGQEGGGAAIEAKSKTGNRAGTEGKGLDPKKTGADAEAGGNSKDTGSGIGADGEAVPGGKNATGPKTGIQPRAEEARKVGDPLTVEFDFTSDDTVEGKALEGLGKNREAVLHYREVIKANPGDISAWRALGDVYDRLGRKDYAALCYGKVLKLEPDNKDLVEWLRKYKATGPK